MLHEKAVKKVEKALGVKVELIGNCRYGCTYDGYVLSWLVQRKWRSEGTKLLKDGPLEASNWHIRFPVGSLVQGKENKRAQRQGYANRLAIVTEAGQYMYLKWVSGKEDAYRISYPERDFKLAG